MVVLEHRHAVVSGVDGVRKAAAADSAANSEPDSKPAALNSASVVGSGEDEAKIDSSPSTQTEMEDPKKRAATESSSDADAAEGSVPPKKQKADDAAESG